MKSSHSTLNFEIKPLNEQEYSQAPEDVRRVYISVLENIPLSTDELKGTIKAHPEYFKLKSQEKPKSFSQKVKRLFTLKEDLRKHQNMIQVTGTVKPTSLLETTIEGTVTNPESIAQLKKLHEYVNEDLNTNE
jgi:hypothetical protein